MNGFALVLIACGVTAVLALVLSIGERRQLARRTAQVSLWLILGAVPIAMAVEILSLWLRADDAGSKATLLGRTISHAMNYGVLALPCAAIAGLALRRANTHRHR